MRLGQLARKLDVKINQIIDFLKDEHQIIIEGDLNMKLDDDILKLVKDNFYVKQEVLTKSDDSDIDVNSSDLNVTVNEETTSSFDANESVRDEVSTSISEENNNENANLDDKVLDLDNNEKLIVEDENGEQIELNVVDGVIKAPKKELSGFKVVGKIDLKKPKKSVQHIKTEDSETKNITEEISAKRKEFAKLKREKYLKRKAEKKKQHEKRRKGRKRRVLTELELKEKQAELLVQKRLEQAKIDKEKKRKHYEQIAKAKQTSNKAKKKKKGKRVDESVVKTVKQYEKEPTTLLGRIWKWFNT